MPQAPAATPSTSPPPAGEQLGVGGGMRIGELAARTGVSTHVLRVWERRYGLLRPGRTASGYRIYGLDDERRVRAVCSLRDAGVQAGEAAARVVAADRLDSDERADGPTSARAVQLVASLVEATKTFDDAAGATVLDEALTSMSVETAVESVLLPYLRQLGDLWAEGSLGVAHEHFGSALVRRRLASLTHRWGVGDGPLVVLACPPGEQHDIVLLAFGVLLGRAGWRVRYLGADTPLGDLARACQLLAPDLVVLSATRERVFAAHLRGLALLARRHCLALAGRGSVGPVPVEIGAHVLSSDPVAAVAEAFALVGRPPEAATPTPGAARGAVPVGA